MKTIEVFRGSDAWYADFINDSEVRRLFGSTVLPTGFRSGAKAAEVIASLRHLNPGCTVTHILTRTE